MFNHKNKRSIYTQERIVQKCICSIPVKRKHHAFLIENAITIALYSLGYNTAGGMWVTKRSLLKKMKHLYKDWIAKTPTAKTHYLKDYKLCKKKRVN